MTTATKYRRLTYQVKPHRPFSVLLACGHVMTLVIDAGGTAHWRLCGCCKLPERR